MQKGFAPILIILGIALLVAAVGGAYYFGQSSVKTPTTVSQVPVSTAQTSVSPTQPPAKTTISPTPTSVPTAVDETANWKTYMSASNNFSIQYPSNARLEVNTEDNISILPNVSIPNQQAVPSISILINLNSQNVTLNTWATQHMNNTHFGLNRTSLPESKTFNGYPVYELIANGSYANDLAIFVSHDAKIYQIELSTVGQGTDVISLLNQILSTFKFTN